MKKIKLVCFVDSSNGELGLGLADMPKDETTNSSLEGTLIAHDILEHVNGPSSIGTIDDELEALGAIWFVRGQIGVLRLDRIGSAYTVHQNIAADITRMFRDFHYGTPASMPEKKSKPVTHESDILEILKLADADKFSDFDSSEDLNEIDSEWVIYRQICLHRLRIGYSKVRAKWRGNCDAANSTFWAIAQAVDTFIKFNELFEGMELTVCYGAGLAYCEYEGY